MMFDLNKHKKRVSKDVTILVKTFNRPKTVSGAIRKIRRFYPDIRVLLADDSQETVEINDGKTEVFSMPFDSGVSKGRNFLLEKVETPYFVMMDDDHYFNRRTHLENMLRLLEEEDFDILSALVFQRAFLRREFYRKELVDFYLNMEMEDGVLKFVDGFYEKTSAYVTCDLVHQFFLANTEAVQQMGGWDDRLKTADHADFFIRVKQANLKVGYTPMARVDHVHRRDERFSKDYEAFRTRMSEFRQIWIEQHNIQKIVNRDGRVFSAQEFIAQKGW
ncbi:glycosyltransferase [Leptothoe spongobia]|uniref:Glycosyltransferase n=1 Tax=Leptothoe spongobia TAU-MAC 1115 TaxID=1967444 RepID=A0A947DIW4_9CYAN|nr:glycosyltransferase [Leptothoe spongobia]MBT9317523.1 glycosyltransferase [Leptothoe spongobia TAU-MAC 1115]